MAAEPATGLNPVRWMTAFIDRPAETFEAATAFWLAVTGTPQPAHLRMQRLDAGPARVHMDLHVAEPAALAERALSLGASVDTELGDGVRLRSPGGLPWSAVAHDGDPQLAPPTVLPDGTRLGVQQICIDIAADAYEAEGAFWSALTGWPLRPGLRPEYDGLEAPAELPLRLLFQRLDQPHEGRLADAHLDVFTSDPLAAAGHHVGLGARIVQENPFWIVMADPSGEPYCLIRRDPSSSS